MSETSQGPGWWRASDGRWYPPEQHPHYQPPHPPQEAPPRYHYPPPAPSPGVNGLAVASLVLGILWLYWIGSILALVFGYIAKRQIRERSQGGAGLATAGIVLGWVGVGTLCFFLVVPLLGAAA